MSTSYYGDQPDNIRRAILNGTIKANDAKARFIGRDAYVAAGGRIEGDLFAAEGDENWIDVDLLEDLAGKKLEDRKSVVSGKSVSVRVDLGGRRIIKNKKK